MPQAFLKTLHLKEPFRIAHGVSDERQVVRLLGDGVVGEAPFVPYYQEDQAETLACLQAGSTRPLTRAAGLALDLFRLDQEPGPLWRRAEAQLGTGRPWGEVLACRSLGIPTEMPAFAERVREVSRQFRVLKLKLGSGDLVLDEAIMKTACSVVAPGTVVFADVNGGWSVDETVTMVSRLRGSGLVLIEQPIHHRLGVEGWRELKAKMPPDALPLYADESAQNADDVQKLAGLVAGVNVKLLKCGTFQGAVEMIQTARKHHLGVILGCMIESSIGTTAAAHLAPWADYVDVDGHLYLADDDYAGVTFSPEGHVVLPEGNGIGARLRA